MTEEPTTDDLTKLSKFGHMCIEQICAGADKWNWTATLNAIGKDRSHITEIRNNLRDVNRTGILTPEDQKLIKALAHALNRLFDVYTAVNNAAAEYDVIMSELREMAETDKLSDELYRHDSEEV